jgi:hypothetical protein
VLFGAAIFGLPDHALHTFDLYEWHCRELYSSNEPGSDQKKQITGLSLQRRGNEMNMIAETEKRGTALVFGFFSWFAISSAHNKASRGLPSFLQRSALPFGTFRHSYPSQSSQKLKTKNTIQMQNNQKKQAPSRYPE